MNRVEVSVEGVEEPQWTGLLVDYALAVLDRLGKDGWDVSLLLCGDETMRKLNAQYRQKDEATDVLSFELGESFPGEDGSERWAAGDIVISLDTSRQNAEYFSVSADEELRRLVAHGILHLSGMDHEDNDASRPMLVLQESILADLSDRNIIGSQKRDER
jgi:probable rRNA maturation factor